MHITIKAGYKRYHVVDFANALERMAFRRNNGVPSYILPDYMANRYPVPDTRYYERSKANGAKGGIFSLDGVHPTAIGHGLIAYEFMKVMYAANVLPESKTHVQIIHSKIADSAERVPDWIGKLFTIMMSFTTTQYILSRNCLNINGSSSLF